MEETTSGDHLHIIATGAATSLGSYAAATLVAVQARIANFADHPYLLDLQGEPYILAAAPYIDPDYQGIKRYNVLLNYALSDCCAEKEGMPASMPCVLCLPNERPTFRFDQVRDVAQQLVNDCPGLVITSQDLYCQGHAAAYQALEQVQQHLLHTAHEFCLLAGVDSYIDSATLNYLEMHSQVHNATNAYGFVPGEAAACVLLCTQDTVDKYQLTSLGTLLAFSHAFEPVHHTQGVCTGQGLTQAMHATLQHCPPDQKIQHVICDLNGEPHRSDEYGFTLTRLSYYLENPDHFTAPADCWGDVGAATGVLSMVLATANPVSTKPNALTLLWASSVQELRSALLLKQAVINH